MRIVSSGFGRFDLVRILRISRPGHTPSISTWQREPRVGDVAVILDVYESPAGYELECTDDTGRTLWVEPFRLDEIELELMKRHGDF